VCACFGWLWFLVAGENGGKGLEALSHGGYLLGLRFESMLYEFIPGKARLIGFVANCFLFLLEAKSFVHAQVDVAAAATAAAAMVRHTRPQRGGKKRR